MKRNNQRKGRGQSMAEYALGLACVAALVMVVLGSWGHELGEFVWNCEQAMVYGGTRPVKPGRTVNAGARPWIAQ